MIYDYINNFENIVSSILYAGFKFTLIGLVIMLLLSQIIMK